MPFAGKVKKHSTQLNYFELNYCPAILFEPITLTINVGQNYSTYQGSNPGKLSHGFLNISMALLTNTNGYIRPPVYCRRRWMSVSLL